MNLNIQQDGNEVIQFFMRRTGGGVEMQVHAAPEVEEFFRHYGGGRKQGVREVGRLWTSPGGEELTAWRTPTAVAHGVLMEQLGATVEHLGHPFLADGMVNISFLRLVGLTDGVTFTCDTVIGRRELENVVTRLHQTLASFYEEYLKGFEYEAKVAVREPRQVTATREVDMRANVMYAPPHLGLPDAGPPDDFMGQAATPEQEEAHNEELRRVGDEAGF